MSAARTVVRAVAGTAGVMRARGLRAARATDTEENGMCEKLLHPNGAVYEGEIRDGVPHGQGKETHPDGLVFESEWRDGDPLGKGTVTFPDGAIFVGKWREGEHE